MRVVLFSEGSTLACVIICVRTRGVRHAKIFLIRIRSSLLEACFSDVRVDVSWHRPTIWVGWAILFLGLIVFFEGCLQRVLSAAGKIVRIPCQPLRESIDVVCVSLISGHRSAKVPVRTAFHSFRTTTALDNHWFSSSAGALADVEERTTICVFFLRGCIFKDSSLQLSTFLHGEVQKMTRKT